MKAISLAIIPAMLLVTSTYLAADTNRVATTEGDKKIATEMSQIRATNDTKKRKQLMKSHLNRMRTLLRNMGNSSQIQNRIVGRKSMTIVRHRLDMIEERLDLMQALVEGMMEKHVGSLEPDDEVYQYD